MNAPIDPGEGWRLLEVGEILKEDDEYFLTIGGTNRTAEAGLPIAPEKRLTYRRRIEEPKPTIDPGEKYRLLLPHEIVIAGDEYCVGVPYLFSQWEPAPANVFNTSAGYARYRRRVASPETVNPTTIPPHPCPFCQSSDSVTIDHTQEDAGGHRIAFCQCLVCNACGPIARTPRAALMLWNDRG